MNPVLAFDCVGTVFDASGVPGSDMRSYVEQVRRPHWAPLQLADSFYDMPAHADAAEGIARLRKKYRVVTCSNLPMGLLHLLSVKSGIVWDAIVPLEASRTYKPSPEAYRTVCSVMQASLSAVTVVTAHSQGPDVEGAPAVGMKCQIIRNERYPKDILELASVL